jgi:hypothetical protein
MVEQPLSLSLLEENALEPFGQFCGKNHVRKPNRGRLNGEKVGEFPSWLQNYKLTWSTFQRSGSAFRFFDQFAKLLRHCSMSQFRLVCSTACIATDMSSLSFPSTWLLRSAIMRRAEPIQPTRSFIAVGYRTPAVCSC